jgi:hypothetical protein
MPAPIPVVTPIDTFLELPAGGTVALSCAGSTALPGASYQWQLIEAPDGSAATLQNALTATPTLTNVDTRGTYIVFLKITDSGGNSHPQPYPVQATSVPYGFSTPLATAFGVVRVAESPTGLVKPGRGEYGWFEQGLWPIVDKINDGLSFEYYDEPTRTLTANAVMPDSTTGADAVEVNGLNITDTTASIVLTTDGNPLVIGTATTVSSVDLTVLGGLLKADEITDASGGDLKLTANAGILLYGGTQGLIEAPDEVKLDASGNIVRVSPSEVKLASGDNLIRVRDEEEAEPDILITAGAAGADVVVSATAQVRVTAGTDISIVATSADGDIALSTEGATGNINISTEGYVAGITVATEGSEADISITTTGAAADITLNAGNNLAAYSTGLARLSGGTAEVIGGTQLSLNTDDGNGVMTVGGNAVDDTLDRYAQVTFFSENNKRRVIDLDGYVSQRNHRLTAGGSTTQITPNGTLTYVPLRNDVVAGYTYESLCGASSATPDFVLSFQAAFIVTQFTTSPGNYLTLELALVPTLVAPPATVTLATVTFQPETSVEVTAQPCIISGTVHSTGGKFLYTAATATLQLNSATAVTRLSAASVDASAVLAAGGSGLFVFRANSNDSNAIIGNVSASFTLLRGS